MHSPTVNHMVNAFLNSTRRGLDRVINSMNNKLKS